MTHLETHPVAIPGDWTESQSEPALLARVLNASRPTPESEQAAAVLLQRHGGLPGVFRVARAGGACDGEPDLKPLAAALELCRRRQQAALRAGTVLSSPAETGRYLQTCLQDRSREVFMVLFLDTRHRVIRAEELFQGSIDGACVYPRVVAERALRLGAAAVIAAHNHPSGIAEPSLADQAITRRLSRALSLLDIRLLDHIVIGDGEPVSMASRGLV